MEKRITIVGAGPAGTSLAIRLALQDFQVTLVEREKFPRNKLCGEFISPECLSHFQSLGVLREILAEEGDKITKTVFYEPQGISVTIPSKWFNAETEALGLSRARMDFNLLERAKNLGVEVLEETSFFGFLLENETVCGIKAKKKSGEVLEIASSLTIDATGRAKVLSKFLPNRTKNGDFLPKNQMVGFKTHLKNVDLEKGSCEIYFFRGGYGGLSFVEEGKANHCFLVRAEVVKEFKSNAEKIWREVIFQNTRAAETMKNSEKLFEWLAVAVDGFGVKNLVPTKNVLAIGDAGAFIDPFTGSGMLMALESSEILAKVLSEKKFNVEEIAKLYQKLHQRKFQRRLLVCSIMRQAAFVPSFAKFFIKFLSLSEKGSEYLAKATRPKTVKKQLFGK